MMKTLCNLFRRASVLVILTLLGGCVDGDYDLSKAETDDLTFGDEYILPLGRVSITLQEMLDLNSIASDYYNSDYLIDYMKQEYDVDLTAEMVEMILAGTIPPELTDYHIPTLDELLESLDATPVPIPDQMEQTSQVELPIDESLVYTLSEGGTLKILGSVENGIALSVRLTLQFLDGSGQVVCSPVLKMDNGQGILAGATGNESAITAFESTISADDLEKIAEAGSIRFTFSRVDDTKVIIHNDDYVKLTLRLTKTGGIRF